MTAPPTSDGRDVTSVPDDERPSVGDLLGDVSRDLSVLVRQELQLAKAEGREAATKAGKGAGMLAGATSAAHYALLFLSVAVWWAIGNGTGRGWAALIVTALWVIVALALAMFGKRELTSVRGLDRTTETIKKIPPAARGHEEQNR